MINVKQYTAKPSGKKVYPIPQWEILGVSKEDKELVEKLIMQQLS